MSSFVSSFREGLITSVINLEHYLVRCSRIDPKSLFVPYFFTISHTWSIVLMDPWHAVWTASISSASWVGRLGAALDVDGKHVVIVRLVEDTRDLCRSPLSWVENASRFGCIVRWHNLQYALSLSCGETDNHAKSFFPFSLVLPATIVFFIPLRHYRRISETRTK
jgi:hypothetical protein